MTDHSTELKADARGAPRERLLLIGKLSVVGQSEPKTVRIRNLSATGMMAEAVKPPAVGVRATIDLRNVGPVNGVVKWAADGRFGMAFDQPISPAEVRMPANLAGAAAANFLRPYRPLE